MKDQILKLAGVKSEAAFYKKYPTEEAFMKVHGKAFKKAAMGAKMVKDQLTQLTDFSNPPKAWPGIDIDGDGIDDDQYGFGSVYGQPQYNAATTAVGGVNPNARTAQQAATQAVTAKLPGDKLSKMNPYLQAGMDVVEGISMIKDQNEAVKSAKQESLLTGVQADAAASQRRQPMKNYYTRPEDIIIQPEQLYPSYGVGSNILSAKNGTEIQNTYAPNDLYDDLGYEPLNDNERVKAFYHGGKLPMAQNGFETFMTEQGGTKALGNISNMLINRGRGPSAGSKIGGGVGAAAGTFFGGPVGAAVGKFAGQAIGSLIDQSGRNIEKYNKQSDSNIAGMMGNYIPQQFSNVMEDGGWVSNDWQPQTITKFGEYDMEDLLAPDETMNTLRTGGNIRQNQLAMGGELQVYRGEAEPISNNPYLPDGGETVMFRGPSHENGGMPISYGQSPVEVEGGEPAVKLRDGGGEDNLVVFGNLKINKDGAEMLGNPKLKNKKFKNYVNDLSKIEAKQNKLIDKSVDTLDNLDVKTSFDKLTMSALEANLLGGNMKLKNIADKKQDAAALQSAINDTAEEYGVVADDLAQGKIKMDKSKTAVAKYGKNIPKAQMQAAQAKNKLESSPIDTSALKTLNTKLNLPGTNFSKWNEKNQKVDVPNLTERKKEFDWLGQGMNVFNQALPFLRPSDVERLDPRQLMGEMYALSNNQLEPVQAQTYQPQLQTPYDISLQDQLNEITAQTRQAERLAQNNPEALAAIYGQAEMAKSKVLGEQMRINQGQRAQVYGSNINTLNQAQLQNLQMYDTQQQRQEAAKSATKATTQEALNSISAKYAQNKLENKQLATMENLYNYRFDKSGRAINMNPLVNFDEMIANASPDELDKYKALLEAKSSKEKTSKKESRNGSIVKAIKNL
jgi:hypothetical protein